jgi:hypothetical protein
MLLVLFSITVSYANTQYFPSKLYETPKLITVLTMATNLNQINSVQLYLRRRNVFSVRYEIRFSIKEDGVLHSHGRQNLKSYIPLTD